MTEQEIRSAFESYKHPYWKVVGPLPAPPNQTKDEWNSDNYHMFNALYWRLLESYSFKPSIKELGENVKFLIACDKVDGLFSRFPGRTGPNDDISQDEIYGIAFTSPASALAQYDYGSENYYCYWLANPNHFHWDYFFGRFPSFIPYIKASANKPIWFSQFFWCAGFLASALTSHSETSGKLLSYLQIPVMKDHFIPRQAIKVWKWIMMKRYKGIKELYSIYFNNDESNPFVKCAKEDFE